MKSTLTISFYINGGDSFQVSKDYRKGIVNTKAELIYENLEPWIQWPSVHTGKTYDEHKIFRLGTSLIQQICSF